MSELKLRPPRNPSIQAKRERRGDKAEGDKPEGDKPEGDKPHIGCDLSQRGN